MTPEHRRAELQRAYDNQTPADPETDAIEQPVRDDDQPDAPYDERLDNRWRTMDLRRFVNE